MGKVYVLTNDFMPGIVKIGYTTQPIEDRLRELDKTGVPWPFRCHFAIETERYREIEAFVHDAFSDCRVRDNREFFKVSPERVVAALRISGATEIKTDNEAIDQDGRSTESAQVTESGRKRFQFEKYGIPVGSELTFTRNKEKKCRVLENGEVEYEGQHYSLSRLAIRLMNELGYTWKFARGPALFEYDGTVLTDIQSRYDES